MANTKNSIYLRPSLDFDPSKPSQRNNLISFSPDILPLYQTKDIDIERLISMYRSFIAQTVVAEEQNLIYVRGAATDIETSAKATVSVGAVTNELILWPQVLNATEPIGKCALSYTPAKDALTSDMPGVTASAKSLAFTPPGRGGRHDAFVAVSNDSLRKLKDAANYNELLTIVGAPSSVALLNAVVVDPVFDVYSMSTRLRFFDDGKAPVNLELDIEAVGIPSGYSVSIFSDDPKIVLGKTAVDSSDRIGFTVPASNGLDVMITLQVYKDDGAAVLPDRSSISLVAHVDIGSGPVIETVVLGAEHIVFDSAIRISRALAQGRLSFDTAPAQGFYFRDKMGDTEQMPREGSVCHSPDIQPLGTSPVPNIDTVLGTDAYGTDVSDQRGAKTNIQSRSPNYIYLRGATTAATHVEFSMYAIPNNLLITPEMYGSHDIKDIDVNNNEVTAVRELVAAKAGKYTIDTPFNWNNPPQVASNADHWCLIAECRLWAADPNDKDEWPHQKQAALPTQADLIAWILGNPTVALRNISWTVNPNASSQIWQVNCSVPSSWGATDTGFLALVCTHMPVGGSMSFSSTKSANTVLEISQMPITNPDQTAGVHFTGIAGPWDTTITVQWWQGSGTTLSPGASLQMQIQKVINDASALAVHLGKRALRVSDEQAQWPLVVGAEYPHLESNKRKLLLGSAHPIPHLQASGRFEHPNGILVRPVTVATIGADGKGVLHAN